MLILTPGYELYASASSTLTKAINRLRIRSPRSNLTTVSGDTFAAAASFLTPKPSPTRAIRHCTGSTCLTSPPNNIARHPTSQADLARIEFQLAILLGRGDVMAVGRTASLLVFFLILSLGFAWACDPNEKCRPNDPVCEARKKACIYEYRRGHYEYRRGHEYSRPPEVAREPPGHYEYRRSRPPEVASEPPGSIRVGRAKIRASRLFVAPHDFPLERYGAYGIVAFAALSTPETKDRYTLVCLAYWATLPRSSGLAVPISEQMVTVWPVDDPTSPMLGNDRERACNYAVEHYDLTTAQTALAEAADANVEGPLNGIGPYLLAWSPAQKKGEKDTLVLKLDLSWANTSQNFIEQFQAWRKKIEGDPRLWQNGFDPDRVRVAIKYWVDRWGSALLSVSSK